LRRADDAWAIQMGRAPKARKTLMLIGIVCDDEIKDTIDLKTAKDKSKMVRERKKKFIRNIFFFHRK
jgi:ACT domain-containing protein